MNTEEVMQCSGDYNFAIEHFGECTVPSPIRFRPFVQDKERVLISSNEELIRELIAENKPLPAFERAGPRQLLFHDPAWTRAAIVTCGGLCPGLNDVIKGIVTTLYYGYNVKSIFGIRYGYAGLVPGGEPPMELDPEIVDKIHMEGGTILGSSRGFPTEAQICDTLRRMRINVLFTIGGDGTLRAAHDIAEELKRRGENISVIGIPKTIDNDLSFIGRSFGFETSVYKTATTLTEAHTESKGTKNGIGLVKLMGRDSGFIAAYASLANSVVNYCLIPEEPLILEGESGLLRSLERRFKNGKDHAVIVVAEGAGQNLFEGMPEKTDASGNILNHDIGLYLKSEIEAYLSKQKIPCSIKYFDPSYSVRSGPAYGTDAILCYSLADAAVHAAMAGRTDMVVGHIGEKFTHVPIPLATSTRQHINTSSAVWSLVLSSTRQERSFRELTK